MMSVTVRTSALGMRLIDSSPAWLVLIGMLVGYFTLLLALGGHHAWDKVGVPAVSPGFFDLRSVTSGWDCARQHRGAWPDNPCDPWQRPENYPRIWMAAAIFGLGANDTNILGTLIAIAFFGAAIAVLPRSAPLGDAVVYGLALCSPAVMMGVERGNVDIALFAMVATAGLVMRRTPWGPSVASAFILVAAILKLFPIAAVGMLAQLPRRTSAICVASVGGIFAVYGVATFRDIQTIARVLPQDDQYAYGIHIFGAWLGRVGGPGRVWDIAVVGLALAVATALARRVRQGLDPCPSRSLDLLWAGAGIYIATFVFVRSADYRLVFLLLTIPQLVRWAASGRVLPIATLCGVLLTLWLPSEWDNVPVINHLIDTWNNWTLAGGQPLPIAAPAQVLAFAGLACVLVATFPVAEHRSLRRPHESVTGLASRRASV